MRRHFAIGYAEMAASFFQEGFLDRSEQAFRHALAVDGVSAALPVRL